MPFKDPERKRDYHSEYTRRRRAREKEERLRINGPIAVRKKTGRPPSDPIPRFWAKVDRSNDPNQCWEWTASRDKNGYGYFHPRGIKSRIRAHRYSWILAHGEIPDALGVLHRCDNPKCVNPTHLFLGTNTDNNADCRNKGRNSWGTPDTRGQANGQCRLSEWKVCGIAARWLMGLEPKEIAKEYNVSVTHAFNITHGKRWGWLFEEEDNDTA